ncbi:hypothetical protein [Halorientalis halophila]|uniref:hypothetical protein n=1 Tax=Halorientalis halophila TaxID=3108499 RepID=UPI003008DB02
MYRPVQYAGYLALLATPAVLLADAVGAWPGFSIGRVTLWAGIVAVGGLAAVTERERAFGAHEGSAFDRTDALDAAAVAVAAVVTYWLAVYGGVGPVVAAAAVGLAAGLAFSERDVAAYCGSFVGMASPSVFPTAAAVLVAGVVSGVAFVAARESFGGVGGKLGTLALFGVATTVAVTGFDYAAGTVIRWPEAPPVVAVAVMGAVATVVLSLRLELGPVVGSALVGLVAGVAFPLIAPATGATLAAVAFCASFVGMSSADRLGDERHAALAGALSGVVFVLVSPALAGAGGKLGTVAFVSCVSLVGLRTLHDGAIRRRR